MVLVAAVVALGFNYVRTMRRPQIPLPPAVRSNIPLPIDRRLDSFAISPDERTLGYAAESPDGRLRLYLRAFASDRTTEIADSTGAHDPFFSPDSRSIGFFANDGIWIAAVDGSQPRRRVCDAVGSTAGATWTDQGRIVFAPLGGRGLMSVAVVGGTPQGITTLNKRELDVAHGWPQALPGGDVLFTVSQRGRDPHLEIWSSGTRGPRLVPVIGQAGFVSTGHLVYSYLGDLYAVAFDASQRKTAGAPVLMAKGIQTLSGFDQLGRSAFAVSRGGMLAWVRSSGTDQNSLLVKVTLDGSQTPLAAASDVYTTPRISPDGRKVAVAVRSGLMTREIRVLDMNKPTRIIATLRGGDNQSPAWMPDGRLSFASNREGLQKMYVTTDPLFRRSQPMFSTDVQVARNPSSWTRKPPQLAFYEIDQFRGRDVLLYKVDQAIVPVAATPANERSPVLAPDGASIAWVSDASGRDEVYAKNLSDESEPRQISTDGGVEPVWTRAGLTFRVGERFVRDGKTILAAPFEHDLGANAASYDIDANDRFLLLLKTARRPGEIRVVKNWGTELAMQVKAP